MGNAPDGEQQCKGPEVGLGLATGGRTSWRGGEREGGEREGRRGGKAGLRSCSELSVWEAEGMTRPNLSQKGHSDHLFRLGEGPGWRLVSIPGDK